MNIDESNSDVYFKDERGEIINLLDGYSYIVSKAGSNRALHYHKTSSHTCVLTKGSLNYYERPVGSKFGTVELITAPHAFFTDKLVEHWMQFLTDSEMVCVRHGGSMTKQEYDDDLVKIVW